MPRYRYSFAGNHQFTRIFLVEFARNGNAHFSMSTGSLKFHGSTHMLFVGRCWFPELELSADLPTPSDDRVLFTSDCHRLDSRGIDKISSDTIAPPLRRYLDLPSNRLNRAFHIFNFNCSTNFLPFYERSFRLKISSNIIIFEAYGLI